MEGSRTQNKNSNLSNKSKKQNLSNQQKKQQQSQQKKPPRNRVRKPRNRGNRGAKGNKSLQMPVARNLKGFASNRDTMIISENEYIGEVTVANQPNFNTTMYPVNPGQASTFPWLSTIAKNFEKYRFKRLIFEFRPEVTQFTANTNTGKVVMSADYDSSDPSPLTKQQQLDTKPHNDGMPYEYVDLVLSPTEMHEKSVAKFVRPAGLPGGSDIKTYDCANVFVSTQGQTANSVLGELHVIYEVELSVPVLENLAQAPANNAVSIFTDSAAALTTTVPYQPLLAAPASATVMASNGCLIVNTAGSLIPPPGNYLVDVTVNFVGGGGIALSECLLEVLKNGNIQNLRQGWVGNTAVTYAITQSWTGFLACNGTDAITLSLVALFSAATLAATTTVRFVAI